MHTALRFEELTELVEEQLSGRLARAVANLLDNAAKFGPSDGVVTVEVADGRLRVSDRFYRSPGARAVPGAGRLVVELHSAKDGKTDVADHRCRQVE